MSISAGTADEEISASPARARSASPTSPLLQRSARGAGEGAASSPSPAAAGAKLPLQGEESLMAPKAHGTTPAPVQANLRWGVDQNTADKIVSFNRHYA